MDEKMVILYKNSQNSFYTKWEERVLHLKLQIKQLQSQVTEETLRRERDTLVLTLKEECKYYKEELLKTDESLKKIEKAHKNLLEDYQEMEANNKLLLEQLFEVKKENKVLFQEKTAAMLPGKKQESSQFNLPKTQRNMLVTTSEFNKTHSNFSDNVLLNLQKQLEFERKRNKSCVADKVKFRAIESEYKDFFVSCLEEVKKDIIMRQAGSQRIKQLKSKYSIPPELFKNEKLSIPLSAFLGGDKKKVIKLVCGNDKLIEAFSKFIFPENDGINTKSGLAELIIKSKTPTTNSLLELKKMEVEKLIKRRSNYSNYKPKFS